MDGAQLGGSKMREAPCGEWMDLLTVWSAGEMMSFSFPKHRDHTRATRGSYGYRG